jgi:hypothetical protein
MKKIFLIISSVLVLASCKKGFLDINENPNSPTPNSATPELVLTAALNNTANRLAVSYSFMNRWLGQWAPSGSFSANSQESTYNLTTGFGAGIWNNIYDNLYDYDFIESKSKQANLTFYEGIAKVMKAVCFHELVDIYNNVPYTSAFNYQTNIRPTYDNGRVIYNDLFKLLEDGRLLIVNATAVQSKDLGSKDIMFKGDKALWRKFINTLKLRLLLRQSEISGFLPTAVPQNGGAPARNVIAEITGDGSGFLSTDAAVNPGYLSDKANPFWATYGFSTVNVVVNKFDYANNYVLNLMKGMNSANGGANSDLRYQYFFKRAVNTIGSPATTPIPSHWRGVDYGLPPATSNAYNTLSNIGGTDNDNLENLISSAPQVGLCKRFNQDQWILTSVESNFLQAEAIQRGWLPGNAKTVYEEAIASSFRWLNYGNNVATANTAAAAYVASADTRVNWTNATNKIYLILLQKYISLCGMQPLEIWSDWRRVSGYVTIPVSVAPGTTATSQPVRLLYPQVEYNTNTDNVQAQGTINQFTSKVFWDQ